MISSIFSRTYKIQLQKLCTAYAGDDFTQKVKFDFNLINSLKYWLYQKNLNKSITFEELEDIIFASFKSVKQYSKFNFKMTILCILGMIDHCKNLDKYFKNYKFIFVNRNILNRLLSNIKIETKKTNN